MSRPERRKWAWWERLLYWLYNFFVGPFLTKLKDGTIMGSMTRWAVFLILLAEVNRLWDAEVGSVTLPEAFVLFCVLFALAIDAKLNAADPNVVTRSVTGMLGQAMDRAGGWFSSSTFSVPTTGEVLGREQLEPPTGPGRPDDA